MPILCPVSLPVASANAAAPAWSKERLTTLPIEAVCDAESLLVWSIAATPNIGPLKVWEYDAKGGDWHSLADAQRRAREPSARLMRFTSLPTEKTLSLN